MTGTREQKGPNSGNLRRLVSPIFGTIELDFLVRGEPHDCAYLPSRQARDELFLASEFPPELYHDFMDHGFRRSGRYFYRPVCHRCRECRPIRVVVPEFDPNKSMRRVMRRNLDVVVRPVAPKLTGEKYELFLRYLAVQHGSWAEKSPAEVEGFLYDSSVHTVEFECHLNGRLIASSIADICSRSLSSVYAYFDPEYASRSLGTFSAIREIAYCREHGIPYYYLGFLVAESSSMSYKARFKPHEILDATLTWVRQPGG